MSVIDEVKQRVDIAEVIGQYATLKKAGRNLSALCPFHTEKTPSFIVYPDQQSWHCFGSCSTGGDVFSFIMKKENMDFGEALRFLAGSVGITVPSRYDRDSRSDEKEKLYQINETASLYFHNLLLNSPAGEKARGYLSRRAISGQSVSDFQLGFGLDNWEALKPYLLERGYSEKEIIEAGLLAATEDGRTHDRFRNRLIFPISDSGGRTIGFGARVLDDSLPKYVNSPQTPLFDKSSVIFGLHLAAQSIRRQELVVLVEGYMDVITAHQHGFKNVVAAMGTSVTERQITVLKRMTRNIALALDADSAGEEAMLRCVGYENTLDAEMKVIILPEGKDPDDVIRTDAEQWQRLIEESVPVMDYTFNMVASGFDLTTASGQTMLVNRLGPIVLEIKDPIRKSHYVQKLARLTGKDVRTIELALSGIKPALKPQRSGSVSMKRALPEIRSHPVEEDFLALLLQHPELGNRDSSLLPEYFQNSENREIFTAWQQTDDPASVKDGLDPALLEHFETLANRTILATRIEERYNKYILRLREDYLRGLARKRASVTEMEDMPAGLPLEEDVNVSNALREVFAQRARRDRRQRS